jgi:IS66 Orf2 like protein
MFGLGPATKIYIAVEGVDMRKGFDGLFGLVRDRLGQDPLSGASVPILQSRPKPTEGAGMGRQWPVGLCEAPGEGAVPLASSSKRRLCSDAAGRTGDAGQWAGSCRRPAAEELAAARAGRIKHFRLSLRESTRNYS